MLAHLKKCFPSCSSFCFLGPSSSSLGPSSSSLVHQLQPELVWLQWWLQWSIFDCAKQKEQKPKPEKGKEGAAAGCHGPPAICSANLVLCSPNSVQHTKLFLTFCPFESIVIIWFAIQIFWFHFSERQSFKDYVSHVSL